MDDYGKGGSWCVETMSNRGGRGASLAKCKALVVEIGTALSTSNSPNIFILCIGIGLLYLHVRSIVGEWMEK